MAKKSAIEWCDSAWSPWRGCTKVSSGCKNCYAERRSKWTGEDFSTVIRSKTTFNDPLKWKESRRIFVGHLSDFFHKDADRWRKEAMDIIFLAAQHTYLILTKRPERVNETIMKGWWHVCLNAWLGVSVENNDQINRLSLLYPIPASKKFLSAEPLLGPLDLSEHMGFIDWVITGGESGLNARPMDLDWVRDIRDQCDNHGVPFFHKQHGGSKKINGTWGGCELDGKIWNDLPE